MKVKKRASVIVIVLLVVLSLSSFAQVPGRCEPSHCGGEGIADDPNQRCFCDLSCNQFGDRASGDCCNSHDYVVETCGGSSETVARIVDTPSCGDGVCQESEICPSDCQIGFVPCNSIMFLPGGETLTFDMDGTLFTVTAVSGDGTRANLLVNDEPVTVGVKETSEFSGGNTITAWNIRNGEVHFCINGWSGFVVETDPMDSSCVDSDAGDIYEFGIAYYNVFGDVPPDPRRIVNDINTLKDQCIIVTSSDDEGPSRVDSCRGTDCFVEEAGCYDRNGEIQLSARQFVCPNGCREGACLITADSCTDTDNGINIFSAGFAYERIGDTFKNVSDSCTTFGPPIDGNAHWVAEAYCEQGRVQIINKPCNIAGENTHICQDGRCVGVTPICGNDRIDAGEECDGSAFGSISSCTDFGSSFVGDLACNSDCKLDRSGCTQIMTIRGIQGYDPVDDRYTDNIATAGKYLIIYGTLLNQADEITVGGIPVSPSAVSSDQINVRLPSDIQTGFSVRVVVRNANSIAIAFVEIVEKVKCQDSDGGQVFDVKGFIRNGDNEAEDLCMDTNTLSEYYCGSDERIYVVDVSCPNGCSNGACNNRPIPPPMLPPPPPSGCPDGTSPCQQGRGCLNDGCWDQCPNGQFKQGTWDCFGCQVSCQTAAITPEAPINRTTSVVPQPPVLPPPPQNVIGNQCNIGKSRGSCCGSQTCSYYKCWDGINTEGNFPNGAPSWWNNQCNLDNPTNPAYGAGGIWCYGPPC